jgi:hypothetical protein
VEPINRSDRMGCATLHPSYKFILVKRVPRSAWEPVFDALRHEMRGLRVELVTKSPIKATLIS